ncbi:DUF1024 family protein, partial [Staphylococcus aureus]
YHPKMMLKIILYAYTQSVFSGRRIEKLLHDSIRMMWLAQDQTPSYKTINRFRVNPNTDAWFGIRGTEATNFILEEMEMMNNREQIEQSVISASAYNGNDTEGLLKEIEDVYKKAQAFDEI